MKINKLNRVDGVLLVAALCIVISSLVSRSLAESFAKPPSEKDLLGAWVGYDDGCLYFYRIVLSPAKKGSCVVLFNDELAGTYRIEDWGMTGSKLLLGVTPEAQAEDIRITPMFVDELKLEVTIEGTTNTWTRKVSLYNEGQLLKRQKKATNVEPGKRAK